MIWPSKPLVGIDYAKWRGLEDPQSDLGVSATISTGMIGGGILNFGTFFGPVAAGIIMALWTGLLIRWWQQRDSLLRLMLFMPGPASRSISVETSLCWCFGLSCFRTVSFVSLRCGLQNTLALRRKSQRNRRLSLLPIFNRQGHQSARLGSNRLSLRRDRNWEVRGFRTPGLLIANETLYQLSYTPVYL